MSQILPRAVFSEPINNGAASAGSTADRPRSLSHLTAAWNPAKLFSFAMRSVRLIRGTPLLLLLPFLILASAAFAQQKTPPPESSASLPRLTIEVTGGTDNKPLENASVYVKTQEDHLLKDKKTEQNVKTNMQGIAHIPDPPTGRVLIQVVADGWKPYGHWFDITDLKQVVKIHLDRPPKWY